MLRAIDYYRKHGSGSVRYRAYKALRRRNIKPLPRAVQIWLGNVSPPFGRPESMPRLNQRTRCLHAREMRGELRERGAREDALAQPEKPQHKENDD
ncbi:MAG: hypothetical protein AABM33_09200, partial [Pseudomonadota bacterium]